MVMKRLSVPHVKRSSHQSVTLTVISTRYTFECDVCQLKFKRKDVRDLHLKTHSRKRKSDESAAIEQKKKKEIDSGELHS